MNTNAGPGDSRSIRGKSGIPRIRIDVHNATAYAFRMQAISHSLNLSQPIFTTLSCQFDLPLILFAAVAKWPPLCTPNLHRRSFINCLSQTPELSSLPSTARNSVTRFLPRPIGKVTISLPGLMRSLHCLWPS